MDLHDRFSKLPYWFELVTDRDEITKLSNLYEKWTGVSIKLPPLMFYKLQDWIAARDKLTREYIGACVVIYIDDYIWNRKWGLVENVYVKENYRRCGVGKYLMAIAEINARYCGCDFIKLTSSKEAGINLYRQLNYKEGHSFRKNLERVDGILCVV